MQKKSWLSEELDKYSKDIEFLTQETIIDITETIVKRMKELRMNKAELARRLGVSKPFITKLLNGNPNMTIKTLVSIANALDCNVKVNFGNHYNEMRNYVVPVDIENVTNGRHELAA